VKIVLFTDVFLNQAIVQWQAGSSRYFFVSGAVMVPEVICVHQKPQKSDLNKNNERTDCARAGHGVRACVRLSAFASGDRRKMRGAFCGYGKND
jgi:hypothetical protein